MATRATYRFDVFGRRMAIERVGERWHCYLLGSEGKRRSVELAVPPEVTREELAQYLYDVYHEDATPTNGDVVEILPEGGATVPAASATRPRRPTAPR